MARKYLDSGGLLYFWTLLKTKFANKVDKEDGKGLSTNDYTTTEKNKLAGIASGAEVNLNAFSNVKVGSTTVAADAKTDTLTLAAGGDVTITPDAKNDKVTISVTTPKKVSDLTNDSGFITLSQVPEGAAASSTTPLMDGIAAVGTETTFARGDHRHPSDTSKQDVIDASHKLSADLVEDGTANKAYTAAEKDKLGGIAAGAEVNVQADWTETSTSSDAYIKNKPTLAAVATSGSYDDLSNKPTIPDDSNLVHKTGNETISGVKTFTQIKRNDPVDVLNTAWNWITYKDMDDGWHNLQQDLDERNNVQADWNQTTTTAADYIKNKPSIPSASATTPKMDGTAAVGTETAFARGDHRHPSDTNKLDTVDTITNAQINEIFSPISFTVGGTSYEAEDGMTWGEWVSSSYYNTGGFYKWVDVIKNGDGDIWYQGNPIAPNDIIVADRAYQIHLGGGND